MRRRTLAAILAALVVMAGAAMADDSTKVVIEKPKAPYFDGISQAVAMAAEKNRPVLVDFYADW